MKKQELITSAHLDLFGRLASCGRISIRSNNKEIELWEHLRTARLCSIFETDRSGTVVIHLTAQGEALAREFVSSLQNEIETADGIHDRTKES